MCFIFANYVQEVGNCEYKIQVLNSFTSENLNGLISAILIMLMESNVFQHLHVVFFFFGFNQCKESTHVSQSNSIA